MENDKRFMEFSNSIGKENEKIIWCNHLRKIYNKGKKNELEILSDISFSVHKGEMVAIMGKSGSGKSTLMHILGGLIPYDDGTYYLDDEKLMNISDKRGALLRNNKIGIVMQDFALIDEFTALENVMIPLDFSKEKNKNKKELALSALAWVHMKEYEKQLCKTMSGGEKQRIAIARAIVNKPIILMADEPTGSLDHQNCELIMELFRKLNSEGLTILLITHDQDVANQCDRIVTIVDGKIVTI